MRKTSEPKISILEIPEHFKEISKVRDYDDIKKAVSECKSIVYGMRKTRIFEYWEYINKRKKEQENCDCIMFDVMKYKINYYNLRTYFGKRAKSVIIREYATLTYGNKCMDSVNLN